MLERVYAKVQKELTKVYKPIVDYYTTKAKKIIGKSDATMEQGNKKATALESIEIPETLTNRLSSFYATSAVVFFYAGYYSQRERAVRLGKAMKLADGIMDDVDVEIDIFDQIEDLDFLSPENAWNALSDTIPIISDPAIVGRILAASEAMGLRVGADETGYLNKFWGRQLNDAIDKGESYKMFTSRMTKMFDNAGITSIKPYHAETVYRTNMADTYNSGRLSSVKNDDFTKSMFPMARYSAIMDNRTTPADASMDGAYLKVDSAEFDEWYPPNHYNCRCIMEFVDKYEIRDANIEATDVSSISANDSKGRPVEIVPATGFVGLSEMAQSAT